jgi:hypothetical protein
MRRSGQENTARRFSPSRFDCPLPPDARAELGLRRARIPSGRRIRPKTVPDLITRVPGARRAMRFILCRTLCAVVSWFGKGPASQPSRLIFPLLIQFCNLPPQSGRTIILGWRLRFRYKAEAKRQQQYDQVTASRKGS